MSDRNPEGVPNPSRKANLIKRVGIRAAQVLGTGALVVGGTRAVTAESPTQPFKDLGNAAQKIGSLVEGNETQEETTIKTFDSAFFEIHGSEPLSEDNNIVWFVTGNTTYYLGLKSNGERTLGIHNENGGEIDYNFYSNVIQKTELKVAPPSKIPTIEPEPSGTPNKISTSPPVLHEPPVFSNLTHEEAKRLSNDLNEAYKNKGEAGKFQPFKIPTVPPATP